MTKFTTTLALVATLSCALLTGCNRQATQAQTPTPTPETKTVTFQANIAPKDTVTKKERFYCGWPTQKDGHPCTRLVKHQGDHCWQHGG